MGMKREAVQEERQRTKERDQSEVESTSSLHSDMPIERILEAEKRVECKMEQQGNYEVNIEMKVIRKRTGWYNWHSPRRRLLALTLAREFWFCSRRELDGKVRYLGTVARAYEYHDTALRLIHFHLKFLICDACTYSVQGLGEAVLFSMPCTYTRLARFFLIPD